jgi:hypothetical protein
MPGNARDAVTLVDVLIDGFEKNDVLGGFHWRDLPMPDEDAARKKFAALSDEAQRWKGEPSRESDNGNRRMVAWPDLELRQAGRGIMVRVRAPRFDRWWQDETTWGGAPMRAISDWLEEERTATDK